MLFKFRCPFPSTFPCFLKMPKFKTWHQQGENELKLPFLLIRPVKKKNVDLFTLVEKKRGKEKKKINRRDWKARILRCAKLLLPCHISYQLIVLFTCPARELAGSSTIQVYSQALWFSADNGHRKGSSGCSHFARIVSHFECTLDFLFFLVNL